MNIKMGFRTKSFLKMSAIFLTWFLSAYCWIRYLNVYKEPQATEASMAIAIILWIGSAGVVCVSGYFKES